MCVASLANINLKSDKSCGIKSTIRTATLCLKPILSLSSDIIFSLSSTEYLLNLER